MTRCLLRRHRAPTDRCRSRSLGIAGGHSLWSCQLSEDSFATAVDPPVLELCLPRSVEDRECSVVRRLGEHLARAEVEHLGDELALREQCPHLLGEVELEELVGTMKPRRPCGASKPRPRRGRRGTRRSCRAASRSAHGSSRPRRGRSPGRGCTAGCRSRRRTRHPREARHARRRRPRGTRAASAVRGRPLGGRKRSIACSANTASGSRNPWMRSASRFFSRASAPRVRRARAGAPGPRPTRRLPRQRCGPRASPSTDRAACRCRSRRASRLHGGWPGT